MVDLVAKSPCADALPLTIGSLQVVETDPGPLSLLMPFAGQDLSSGLAAQGLSMPPVGGSVQSADARAIWFGQDQVLLMGVAPDPGLAQVAAVSDQSDGWCVVDLSGAGAEAVLARLVPVDLRVKGFAQGAVARTLIGHMTGCVMRIGADQFRLMVFRSMAGTLVHDLSRAMTAVADAEQ